MIDDIHNDAQARMAKSIEALRHDLVKIRTGRASTALVDHIKVTTTVRTSRCRRSPASPFPMPVR